MTISEKTSNMNSLVLNFFMVRWGL